MQNESNETVVNSQPQKAVRVYKRTSTKAGCYYTNIVSTTVTMFGFKSRYQLGNNASGEKQHIWFLNDPEVHIEDLPDKAWGYIGGDLVDDKEYERRSKASQPVESNTKQESSTAQAPF
tara:strand:- start:219 stop:575 length:357 start_codon:yes stop_codon:yes gene_type:complete